RVCRRARCWVLLLAPVNAAESPKKDERSIYELIRRLDKRKGEHECARLLYVAATRARRALHLMGTVRVGPDGAVAKPAKGSLLEKLWPVLAGEFARRIPPNPTPRPFDAAAPVVAAARQGTLRRLEVEKFRYETPPAIAWSPPPDRRTRDEIEFTWAGETARHVGSVVHRWLQRISDDGLGSWNGEPEHGNPPRLPTQPSRA